MTRWHKAQNKRLIPRGAGGRFRKATLADVGIKVCGQCGRLFGGPLDDQPGRMYAQRSDHDSSSPAPPPHARTLCTSCEAGS